MPTGAQSDLPRATPNGTTPSPAIASQTPASNTADLKGAESVITTQDDTLNPRDPIHLDADATSFFPDDAAHFNTRTQPQFRPLQSQVAGHEGVLSDENGYVIIKPCRDTEIQFYERVLEEAPAMADCIPAFMGTLELKTPETLASMPPEVSAAVLAATAASASSETHEGEAIAPFSESSAQHPIAQSDAEAYSPPSTTFDRAVVLENLTFGYQRPCVLDLKLGSVLTASDATPEKQARLAAVSERTTSGSMGIRVAGMKVWNAARKQYTTYDRDWGKSLTSEMLSRDVLGLFFGSAIRQSQVHMIASRFLEDVERVLYVLEELEVRLFSSSLLFVYEGDQSALDLAIEEEGKQLINDELGHGITHTDSAGSTASTASSATKARHHVNKTATTAAAAAAGARLPSDYDSDEESDAARDFCICRLIDFAHATFTPGEGPDLNLIKGLKAARGLIEAFLDREFAPQLD